MHWRDLQGSLHPEAPLKRGFARVTDASGKTIMSREAAIEAGKSALRFADGEVGATVKAALHRPARLLQTAKTRPKSGQFVRRLSLSLPVHAICGIMRAC